MVNYFPKIVRKLIIIFLLVFLLTLNSWAIPSGSGSSNINLAITTLRMTFDPVYQVFWSADSTTYTLFNLFNYQTPFKSKFEMIIATILVLYCFWICESKHGGVQGGRDRKEGDENGRRVHVPRGCARGVGQVLAARTCKKEAHHRWSPWKEEHQK